jgi:hypothetical protein
MSDNTTIDGVDDKQVKTYTQAEVDEMTKGLKIKNDELIGERRRDAEQLAADRAEKQKVIEEKEALAIESAQKAGEFEKASKLQSERFERESAALKAELETERATLGSMRSRNIKAEHKSMVSNYASDFIIPESLMVIAGLIDTDVNGDEVTHKFKDFAGNVVAKNSEEYRKWMQSDPVISQLMKADAASGGGATGGRSTGGARKSLKDMSEGERIKLKRDDPEAFKQLLNKR